MNTIGKFKIKDSFTVTGRGLIAIGEIIEGRVKPGCYTTINIGLKDVSVKIAGVDMGNPGPRGEYFVGLLFKHDDETEQKALDHLKLKEQVIDIKIKE